MKLKAVLRDKSLHLAAIFLLAAQVIPNIARAQAQPAPPLAGVLGKVQSFTDSSLDVATPTVIIFPKELRGAAEGSVLTDAPGATAHSRMTNGSVSKPAVSQSRMTNGTAQKGDSSTLVVRYQDGSQTISIPSGVPVVMVAKEPVTVSAGDTVYAVTEKLPDGTLTTNKILQIAAATGSNGQ